MGISRNNVHHFYTLLLCSCNKVLSSHYYGSNLLFGFPTLEEFRRKIPRRILVELVAQWLAD